MRERVIQVSKVQPRNKISVQQRIVTETQLLRFTLDHLYPTRVIQILMSQPPEHAIFRLHGIPVPPLRSNWNGKITPISV